MNDKHEERMRRYSELDEVLQNLYAAPESGADMYAVYKTLGLPGTKYNAYAEIVGDTILGFNKIADMPRLLQQKLGISADESQRIVSGLIEFLNPVVKREEEEAGMKKEDMTKLTEIFSKKAESVGGTQADPGSVSPLRTMEGDMNRIHGYGSYNAYKKEEGQALKSDQDEILKKRDGQ